MVRPFITRSTMDDEYLRAYFTPLPMSKQVNFPILDRIDRQYRN